MSTNAHNDAPDVDDLLTTIAQDFLNVETLEGRKSDDLDFHFCSVWQIKAALRQAYIHGTQRGVEIALR